MSGKLNKVINLFIREADASAGGLNQRGIEAKPSLRTHRGLSFFHGPLNSNEDQLAGRAAFPGSSLMNPPVQVAGQVNGSTDGTGLH